MSLLILALVFKLIFVVSRKSLRYKHTRLIPVVDSYSSKDCRTAEMHWMLPSWLFIDAHYPFFFSCSIRCVFFDIFNFLSIVWFHFVWCLVCVLRGRKKDQNENPSHQTRTMQELRKREMHEVRVMFHGHKNPIRTNTCTQTKWKREKEIVIFFSLFMSFVSLFSSFTILLVLVRVLSSEEYALVCEWKSGYFFLHL